MPLNKISAPVISIIDFSGDLAKIYGQSAPNTTVVATHILSSSVYTASGDFVISPNPDDHLTEGQNIAYLYSYDDFANYSDKNYWG